MAYKWIIPQAKIFINAEKNGRNYQKLIAFSGTDCYTFRVHMFIKKLDII